MKIVDLSLPIDDEAFEVHKVEIERVSHKAGVEKFNRVLLSRTLKDRLAYVLGKRIVRKEDLPDGEFLSLETVHASVHIGTHLDYSFHYGSKSEGRQSKTAEEIPLEWCIQNGVRLDFTNKQAGEVITAREVKQALERIGYVLRPLNIVLFYTGADKFFGRPQYFTNYPAIDTSSIDFLLDSGVKIFGVDTMSIDRPYKFMIKEFMETKDPAKLYPAHFYGRKREFIHIERLANLGSLPDSGFKVHCLPVKIKQTGAAWARVAAELE